MITSGQRPPVTYRCDYCARQVTLDHGYSIPDGWYYREPGYAETTAESEHYCCASCVFLASTDLEVSRPPPSDGGRRVIGWYCDEHGYTKGAVSCSACAERLVVK